MIKIGCILNFLDNSGAETARCIGIFKSSKFYGALLGSYIKVSLQKVRIIKGRKRQQKKGSINTAIIYSINRNISRNSGIFLNKKQNLIILVDQYKIPICNRIKTNTCFEVNTKFPHLKLLAKSSKY